MDAVADERRKIKKVYLSDKEQINLFYYLFERKITLLTVLFIRSIVNRNAKMQGTNPFFRKLQNILYFNLKLSAIIAINSELVGLPRVF